MKIQKFSLHSNYNSVAANLQHFKQVHTWFPEITFVWQVNMCMLVSALKVIKSSSMMWHDKDPG